jgi:glucokinase
MDECFWGIDIGGTNVKLGLVNIKGRILERDSIPTQLPDGPDILVSRIGETCENQIERAGLSLDCVHAFGIGSPGPLDLKNGKLLKTANLIGFDYFPLRAKMSERLQKPSVLDNDANMICWGEFWMGAGKDISDMILYTLGTGIGGAIVCEGELVHGHYGNGGELGHIIVYPDGRECGCGQKGCLEAYASATQIVRRLNEALKLGRESSLKKLSVGGRKITSKDIFEADEKGDELATEIIDGMCKALALASVSMRHATEPQMVVLAGGVSKAGEVLTIRVKRFYEQYMWKLNDDPIEFELAALGDDAGIVGTAGAALHAWEKQQLSPVGQ